MLKIRLQREGRKNDPSYRVVVTEHTRGAKSQNHVDRVGFYHPKTKDQHLNEDKIKHWLSVGAQTSGTVHNMLVKAGIIKAKTINVLPHKTPIVKEVEEVKEEGEEIAVAGKSESDKSKDDEGVNEEDEKDEQKSENEGADDAKKKEGEKGDEKIEETVKEKSTDETQQAEEKTEA